MKKKISSEHVCEISASANQLCFDLYFSIMFVAMQYLKGCGLE